MRLKKKKYISSVSKRAKLMKLLRRNETPEARAERLRKINETARARRAALTPEQKVLQLAYDRAYKRSIRAQKTKQDQRMKKKESLQNKITVKLEFSVTEDARSLACTNEQDIMIPKCQQFESASHRDYPIYLDSLLDMSVVKVEYEDITIDDTVVS